MTLPSRGPKLHKLWLGFTWQLFPWFFSGFLDGLWRLTLPETTSRNRSSLQGPLSVPPESSSPLQTGSGRPRQCSVLEDAVRFHGRGNRDSIFRQTHDWSEYKTLEHLNLASYVKVRNLILPNRDGQNPGQNAWYHIWSMNIHKSNRFYVLLGLLGSYQVEHCIGSPVQKLQPHAIEPQIAGEKSKRDRCHSEMGTQRGFVKGSLGQERKNCMIVWRGDCLIKSTDGSLSVRFFCSFDDGNINFE